MACRRQALPFATAHSLGTATVHALPRLQATIMTDPGMADRTYVGPMTPELVEQILAKVRTNALGREVWGQATRHAFADLNTRHARLCAPGLQLAGAHAVR